MCPPTNLVYVMFIEKKTEDVLFEYQLESQSKIENLDQKIKDLLAKKAMNLLATKTGKLNLALTPIVKKGKKETDSDSEAEDGVGKVTEEEEESSSSEDSSGESGEEEAEPYDRDTHVRISKICPNWLRIGPRAYPRPYFNFLASSLNPWKAPSN